jgi:hypothetical protein
LFLVILVVSAIQVLEIDCYSQQQQMMMMMMMDGRRNQSDCGPIKSIDDELESTDGVDVYVYD